jgi:hypothetical protein
VRSVGGEAERLLRFRRGVLHRTPIIGSTHTARRAASGLAISSVPRVTRYANVPYSASPTSTAARMPNAARRRQPQEQSIVAV